MSTKSNINHAARPGDVLNAFLALSRIYFASTERLSGLVLETARTSLEDCAAAARLAAETGGRVSPEAWQATLGQPVFERARACTRGTYEILAGAQAEAAQVLSAQLAFPAMRFPLTDDWMSAVDRFSRGVRKFSAMSAANVAAATENASEIAARADLLARQAA